MAATKKASVPKASVLGRTLNEVFAAMLPKSQARIAERTAQLQADVVMTVDFGEAYRRAF